MPARLADESLGAFEIVFLPTLEKRRVVPNLAALSSINSLGVAGIAADGVIVFHQFHDGRSLIQSILHDGSDQTTIASIQGAIGSMAVSGGGRIAYVRDLQGVQMPGAYLEEGRIEIPGLSLPAIRALDDGVSWFPDGRQLAYVALADARNTLHDTFGAVGQSFVGWDRRPTVMILDIASGETTVADLGIDPIVSSTGRKIIVRDFERNFRIIDLAAGAPHAENWPGSWGRVIAFLDDRYVVFQGLPTEGSPVTRSPYGSFRKGTQMLPIKVVDLETRKFATLIPTVDPRHEIVFGGVD